MNYRCEVESEELLSYTYQCQTQNTSSFRDVKFQMKNHLIFALQKLLNMHKPPPLDKIGNRQISAGHVRFSALK